MTGYAGGIAFAVPSFMVVNNDLSFLVQQQNITQYIRPDIWMLFHYAIILPSIDCRKAVLCNTDLIMPRLAKRFLKHETKREKKT
jgi:hypothetical protein